MTLARFPHSDTLGSQFACQLPEAYRRLQRPSSAPDAKASTVCSYKLKTKTKRCSRPLYSSQTTHHTRNQPPHRQPATSRPRTPTPHGLVVPHPNSAFTFPDVPPNPTTHAHPHHNGRRTRNARYQGTQRKKIPLRKEVIQPHLPVRLPCYDLAPVTSFTLGRSLRLRTSGTPNFHGLTGGVYKARERIHRAMADARLLANPASRSRVADSDPN